MKNPLFLILAAVLLVAGMLGVMTLAPAVEADPAGAIEAEQEERIPEKPGGIPHALDGPYAECSDCHQLEIPPHPPMVQDCLICHTQQVNDENDER